MYPAPFEYYRADSVREVLELLEDHADEETELLAGGHALLPRMKMRQDSPDVLIDINELDDIIGIGHDGGETIFGALTRYVDIVDSDRVWEDCTPIAEATATIGDVQVRNMGTIGGNIAHSNPASDPPAAVLASNAQIVCQGLDGEREINADDFFVDAYSTALKEHELLTRIHVPNLEKNDAGAYVKHPIPSTGSALIGVATILHTDGEAIESARVAVNGAMDHTIRLEPVEEALTDEPLEANTAVSAADHVTNNLEVGMLQDDIHASNGSRAKLLEEYAERALAIAVDRALDSSKAMT